VVSSTSGKLTACCALAELYSHYLSEASWAGARIVMRQTTSHSEKLFDLLVATFSSAADPAKLADLQQLKKKSGVSDEDWDAVLAYAAQVRPRSSLCASLLETARR